MRSSVDGPPGPVGSGATQSGNNITNNNNNNSSNGDGGSNENNGNSGSQYALCALGLGLIALGVVMIVWSVVPADASFNGSSSPGGGNNTGGRKTKASSVAFVLAGSGVVMLLLSLCLGMRNKRREQLMLQESQNQRQAATRQQEEAETAEEQEQRYAVPTYEEAVGSGQYPVRQSNFRPSTSQLPSYDDLAQVDGVQYENEGPEAAQPASATAASASNRKPGKNNRKLLPIKIRRIKSEKLHMKNNSLPGPGISIEPLTPPPQYDDKVSPL
ncbi:transmembrane protein 51a [Mugil cephalus]|uniref:transmembrane protein 51a n=1 Tax=Mugil cephalus TaxID=48193 RepID=UPI001FB8032E|nr:transmembrane protein 51a [Mugil cephalus]XP_047445723.1 transmembrane protein 51a [Mugil cephalus]